MKKRFLFSFLVIVSACGARENDPIDAPYNGYISRVVSVSDLIANSTGDVTVNLVQPDIGYQVDPGLDISGVTLICPNKQQMNFAQWVELNFGQEGGFIIFREQDTSSAPSENLQEQCPAGCGWHGDGACVCPLE